MKPAFFCIVFLLSVSCPAQETKDTIFFSNGSRIIGELKKIKLGLLTFDPDDVSDITIQQRKISAISAGSKIFRIETIDNHFYFGTIAIHQERNRVYILSGDDTTVIGIQDISVLYAYEKSFAQRFSGSVGLGYSYTRSSGFGRLNFNTDINYASRKGEIIISASGIYTIYDSLFSRDREDASVKYNHYFVRNWFGTVFLAYQRNLELGLQRRFMQGVGIGNKFIRSRRVYSWARTGFVLNVEKSTEGKSSGVLSELFGQLEINFYQFEKPKISFQVAESIFYSLSQGNRFRNDGSFNITWEIINDFDLGFEFYSNFDNKPPVAENRNFDFGIVFSINYKF